MKELYETLWIGLFKIVELETDRIGADAFQTIDNACDFAVRHVAWGFDEDGLLDAPEIGQIETCDQVEAIGAIASSSSLHLIWA